SNANESYVVKLYAGDDIIAEVSLNDVDNIMDGTYKNLTWTIPYAGSNDEYWNVTWYGNNPIRNVKPTKVVFIVDGNVVDENVVEMNSPDNLNSVVWEELENVKPAPGADFLHYAAYAVSDPISDTNDRERFGIDVYNIVAYESFAVESYYNDKLIATTTYRETDRVDGTPLSLPNGSTTVNVVVKGRLAGSWDTVWHSTPNVTEIPNAFKVYVDGKLADEFEGAMSEDNKAKYKALTGTEAVAKINGVEYGKLQYAIDEANGNGTITLLKDVNESATVKASQVADGESTGVTIDLDKFTLTGNLVVDENATAVIKNGKIINTNSSVSAIQSLGTTTLEDIDVSSARHAVRVEGGVTTINGGTYKVNNTDGKTVHAVNVSDGGEVVINDGTFTGPKGLGADSGSAVNVQANSKATINGGTFTGGMNDTLCTRDDGKIVVYNGFFDQDPTPYLAEGFQAEMGAVLWGVVADADKAEQVYVQFKKTDINASNEDTLEESDEYDIVLAGYDAQKINELASADLSFTFVPTSAGDGAMSYTVTPAEDVTLSKIGDRYMFNYSGIKKYEETGVAIVIGKITIDGYGKYTLSTADVETNAVYATTINDNLVDDYLPAADLVINKDMVIDDGMVGEITAGDIKVPTRTLNINITFPNAVEYKEAAYQDMTVTIVGGNVNDEIELVYNAKYYAIEKELPYNTTYTVTVSGAGYRTARYSVTLTEDKTLNFWNNVMDNALEVEVGKATSAANSNFLAGDIVKDNNINIYDLSAVVSYFGTEGLSATNKPEYAKYDLNRDGVIDSKDVAYVLVSWGN
ncbi:MAG: hypothetical protein IJ365_02590, partial [Clostridia bacterium]|nr:hypothetical protein [Clostridia bacterium]